jgi:hypothetical protein
VTALGSVRRTRAALVAVVVGAAVLWPLSVAACLIGLAVVADLVLPMPFGLRQAMVPAAMAAALGSAVFVLWRGRHTTSLARVALYLEERLPNLHFALATVVRPAGRLSPAGVEALESAVARVDFRGAIRAPVARALAVPGLVLAVGLLVLAAAPPASIERILQPVPEPTPPFAVVPVEEEPRGSRLSQIGVTIHPPAYARADSSVLESPSSVSALVGSRVIVRGSGVTGADPDGLGATVARAGGAAGGGQPLAIAVDGDGWSFTLTMPEAPGIVHMRDRLHQRMLVLDPVPDAPPVVHLIAPPRDTSFAKPEGILPIEARLADDIGLARAEIELLYTSGGGELWDTERRVLATARYRGDRTATLRTAIRLDTMQLNPGDVLHIRALAWDQNDVNGPGRGESETRTIRIIDPREFGDPNITAAAAAAIDTSIVSQRMLVMRAESLLVARPRLESDEYADQSIRLGIRQGELRGRVETIVQELENVDGVGFVGETPSSAALREVAEEMRQAERELVIVQVPVALVHMRKALELLEALRDMNRYYLRGLLTTTPVDVERVRLSGRDPASVGPRDARRRAEDLRAGILDQLDRAIRLVEASPEMARDSLQLLFATTLTHADDVARLLDGAVVAMDRGDDPWPNLVAARRLLERSVTGERDLGNWFGTP